MKPNSHDLIFWQLRNLPKWADSKGDPRKALDCAINARVGLHARTNERYLDKSNGLAILRSVRARGESVITYMAWASEEYKKVQPTRAATYRRWLTRASQSR